jgi:uncharacterized membrane protein YphA (DoxX/SURF4 family)
VSLKYSSWLFGIASALAGLFDLIWGEFEPAHQPIQAWSDHIPGLSILARIAAFWLILGGIALLIRPAARTGAAALAVLYGIFCLFPLPRVVSAPHYLGYHPAVYIGVLVSVAQQLIIFIAALLLWLFLTDHRTNQPRVTILARVLFGLSSIDFGLGHFTNIPGTEAMIPNWLPLGGAFWAVLTGIAFLLAGLALISGILDVVAARLFGLMLLVFSVVVLPPRILASPHAHLPWGSNAYNLTAIASAWTLSVCLSLSHEQQGH